MHYFRLINTLVCWLTCFHASTLFAESPVCTETDKAHIWLSPLTPSSGQTIKIMAVATDGPLSELVIIDDQNHQITLPSRRRGGPPWSIKAELKMPSRGNHLAIAYRNNTPIVCQPFSVDQSNVRGESYSWNLATEAFYAAWIEELFGAPHDESFSFSSLTPILQNTERNFLHNYFGLNEDSTLTLTPDCADLPYTLRGYFAWKIGLPFAYRACGRGSATHPPRCGSPTMVQEFIHGISTQTGFKKFSRQLFDTVHSGSARTGYDDESTDFYPIPLNRETLWPGTIFADPYGHILVLTEWIPQTTDHPGRLLAVDAQPDNSVTRKQVWEGTALFANTTNAGAGFKVFRPIVSASGKLKALTNIELINQTDFAPFSREQDNLSPNDFYAALAKLINPSGLDPVQAYEVALTALVEQIGTRINSVDTGESHFRKNPRNIIPMPSGAAIFQTVGAWEDYATPSRDMRLIIAIDVLEKLPQKIVTHPELFLLQDKNPEEIKYDIEQHHLRRVQELHITYKRSNGSSWTLSVADILHRKPQYEVAYNPNDCVEIRWGAYPDTDEYATCRRRAPSEQRAKMEQYRAWFREMRRPIQ